MPDNHLRFLWCDGLEPETYLFDQNPPRITGRAWIGNGPKEDQMHRWSFTLLLPPTAASHDLIDWASLLPADNTTRWLSIDLENRLLEIDPAAAVPDLD